MCNVIVLIILAILNIPLFSFAQEEKKAASQEMDKFSLVQYEDGGGKKWELNGKSAQVDEDRVSIDEISAVAFGEAAALKLKARKGDFDKRENVIHFKDSVVVKSTDGTRLATDSLDWDAGTKNVYTDADVSIKKAAFEVNGKGAVCDLENNTAELKQDITANIAPPETGMLRTTIITCDGPLELNYNKNRAIFRNNVRVEDSEGNIYADRIDVYFNPTTRRIKCVVAKGNVEIVNGENVSYSEKAIYLVDEGRVVLPNKPRLVIQSEQ